MQHMNPYSNQFKRNQPLEKADLISWCVYVFGPIFLNEPIFIQLCQSHVLPTLT